MNHGHLFLVLVFSVTLVKESFAGSSAIISDLSDINATVGETVQFNFTDTDGSNSIQVCKFGLEPSPSTGKPDPVLLEVMYNASGVQTVNNTEKRLSWVGNQKVRVWFKFVDLKTSDTNTYRVWCKFDNSEVNAKANLNVEEGSTKPASTTATASTTQAPPSTTPTTKAKAAQSGISKVFLVVVTLAMFFLN